MTESGRHRRRAEKAGMLVHHHMDRNLAHQSLVAPFVDEGFHERPVFQFGQKFGPDASADVDAVDRHRLQRQIAGFRPVDGSEQLQRLFGDFRLALESRLGDFRGRIAGLDFFRQPGRLVFLRVPEMVGSESFSNGGTMNTLDS